MSVNIKRRLRPGRKLVIGIPYVWLLLLFLIPFFIVLKISFAEQDIKIPPYTDLFVTDPETGKQTLHIVMQNYKEIFQNFGGTLSQMLGLSPADGDSNMYLRTYWSSLKTAFVTTLICLLLGYPMAYAISRAKPAYRNGLLLAIMLPFWTSFLLRVYAWMGLLTSNGIINHLLIKYGIIDKPLNMFYNAFSLQLVMVYAYLPFMILPLYTQLIKLDGRLLPLSKTGIVAGSMLVFVPAVGEFVIPDLVGGSDNLMIGKVLWMTFFEQNNWPLASALAVVMVLLLVVPITFYHRYENRQLEEGGKNG